MRLSTFMAFKLLELLTINKSFLNNNTKIFFIVLSLLCFRSSICSETERSNGIQFKRDSLILISFLEIENEFEFAYFQWNSWFLNDFPFFKHRAAHETFVEFQWKRLISPNVKRSVIGWTAVIPRIRFSHSNVINLLNWNSNDFQILPSYKRSRIECVHCHHSPFTKYAKVYCN